MAGGTEKSTAGSYESDLSTKDVKQHLDSEGNEIVIKLPMECGCSKYYSFTRKSGAQQP